jgi:hypothetical protein
LSSVTGVLEATLDDSVEFGSFSVLFGPRWTLRP